MSEHVSFSHAHTSSLSLPLFLSLSPSPSLFLSVVHFLSSSSSSVFFSSNACRYNETEAERDRRENQYQGLDDLGASVADEDEWVDYVDSFGRQRRCVCLLVSSSSFPLMQRVTDHFFL